MGLPPVAMSSFSKLTLSPLERETALAPEVQGLGPDAQEGLYPAFAVELRGREEQVLPLLLTPKVLLGQGRPVVGHVGLLGDEGHRGGCVQPPERFHGLRRGEPTADQKVLGCTHDAPRFTPHSSPLPLEGRGLEWGVTTSLLRLHPDPGPRHRPGPG